MTELRKPGHYLKSSREARQLTLRAVENATKVSNAYLSQLEHGKIGQPSPTVLHTLADFYQVAYTDLLAYAGYPVPEEFVSGETSATRLAARLGPLSEDEADALADYLVFIRRRQPRKPA